MRLTEVRNNCEGMRAIRYSGHDARFTILSPAVEQSRMGTVMAAKQW